jgi:lipopolysaccharide transport system permease protein
MVIPALFLFAGNFRSTIVLFPVALLGSIVAGTALGILILPVAALYNDVSRAIQLVLRFAFFLAPVVFALPASGIARKIMLLNPATPIIATGRDWLTGSGEAMTVGFILVLAVSLLVLSFGMIVFKVVLPHLIERVAS